MMIPELYFLPADVVVLPPELPFPLWLRLGLAGALALVIALALTVG